MKKVRRQGGAKASPAAALGLMLCAPLTLAAQAACAADTPASNSATVAALRHRLDVTERQLRELRHEVDEQRRILAADRALFMERTARDAAALSLSRARGSSPSQPLVIGQASTRAGAQAPNPAAEAGPTGQAPVGQAPKSPDRPETSAQIFSEPTALTPQGKLVIEPSYQFVHSTDNRVALVGYSVIPALTIGLIDIRRVSRDQHTFSLGARYGLTPRLEIEARVPWTSARSSTLTRPLATPSVTDSFFDSSGTGLGDVEIAARYQINRFRGDNPVYIGYVRYKSRTGQGPFDVPIDPATGLQSRLPTGSGFSGLQAGVTFLVPSDPVVLFGGMAYMHNLGRDVGQGFGRVKPGGIFDFNLGMGLALNERASFSVGYQHSVIGESRQRDPESVARVLAPTGRMQLGTLRFGLAYRWAQNRNINLSLGVGVTRDTPNVELTARFPWTL